MLPDLPVTIATSTEQRALPLLAILPGRASGERARDPAPAKARPLRMRDVIGRLSAASICGRNLTPFFCFFFLLSKLAPVGFSWQYFYNSAVSVGPKEKSVFT